MITVYYLLLYDLKSDADKLASCLSNVTVLTYKILTILN